MPENLPLSITFRADWNIARYEHGRGKSCISMGRDHGRSVGWSFRFGAGTFEMGKTSEW